MGPVCNGLRTWVGTSVCFTAQSPWQLQGTWPFLSTSATGAWARGGHWLACPFVRPHLDQVCPVLTFLKSMWPLELWTASMLWSAETVQGTWALPMPLEPAMPQTSCVFLQSWAEYSYQGSTKAQGTCAEKRSKKIVERGAWLVCLRKVPTHSYI